MNRELVVAVGLDGPTVNITIQAYFLEDLGTKWNTRILDTGTCPLHIVNNGYIEIIFIFNFLPRFFFVKE